MSRHFEEGKCRWGKRERESFFLGRWASHIWPYGWKRSFLNKSRWPSWENYCVHSSLPLSLSLSIFIFLILVCIFIFSMSTQSCIFMTLARFARLFLLAAHEHYRLILVRNMQSVWWWRGDGRWRAKEPPLKGDRKTIPFDSSEHPIFSTLLCRFEIRTFRILFWARKFCH